MISNQLFSASQNQAIASAVFGIMPLFTRSCKTEAILWLNTLVDLPNFIFPYWSGLMLARLNTGTNFISKNSCIHTTLITYSIETVRLTRPYFVAKSSGRTIWWFSKQFRRFFRRWGTSAIKYSFKWRIAWMLNKTWWINVINIQAGTFLHSCIGCSHIGCNCPHSKWMTVQFLNYIFGSFAIVYDQWCLYQWDTMQLSVYKVCVCLSS